MLRRRGSGDFSFYENFQILLLLRKTNIFNIYIDQSVTVLLEFYNYDGWDTATSESTAFSI